jgi:hypothetical protein
MSSADIIRHYTDKGLTWPELRVAIARHVRLLQPLDGQAAKALEATPLRPLRAHLGKERKRARVHPGAAPACGPPLPGPGARR